MRQATSPWRRTDPRRRGATSRTGRVSRSGSSVEGGTELPNPLDRLGELLTHPLGRRTTATGAGGDRALDGEHLAHLRGQAGRDLGQLVVGQVREVAAELLAPAYARAGDLVGLAEGKALAHEPLGDVGREGEALGREGGEACGVEGERRDQPGHRRQYDEQRVDGVEDGLLVLL